MFRLNDSLYKHALTTFKEEIYVTQSISMVQRLTGIVCTRLSTRQQPPVGSQCESALSLPTEP